MKADVSVEFYCYIDEDGMMKYIRQPEHPREEEPEDSNQEELDLDREEKPEAEDKPEEDAELLEQAKEASEAIQKALEEADNGSESVEKVSDDAQTKQPLELSSLLDGIFTGKRLKGNAVFSKDEMRDLLDAEREGLRPLFIVSIK